MPRILVLDSALGWCTAAIMDDGQTLAQRGGARKQGHETVLPVMAREVIAESGGEFSLIAITVGPGSFTGIRAGLALAHGIGLATGAPVIGVTVGEAIADALPHLGHRVLWTACAGRKGYVFIERGPDTISAAVNMLPVPPGPVAIAGPMAIDIAARLAAKGLNVMLTDVRFPPVRHIAAVAERRAAGTLPPRDAQPLYVDPPRVHPAANGQRPPPETVRS